MKKKIIFIFLLFSIIFMPKIVYAAGEDRIHFIKNESGTGDAIVIQSNGHYGLVDTMNPGPTSPLASYDSSLVSETDNGTKVYNYLRKIGCSHLDFVIITHNHPDHNGGISELGDLVDYNTFAIYKTDVIVDDDVDEANGLGNHESYRQEIEYLSHKNAIMCDTIYCDHSNSDNGFIYGVVRNTNTDVETDTNLKDRLSFEFGDFDIDIYNLYTNSNHNENLNSLVTLVTRKDYNPDDNVDTSIKTALMGDLESGRGDIDYDYADSVSNIITNPVGICEECVEYGIEGHIASIIGNVSILKAGSHGGVDSSSYLAFKYLNPNYYIITDVYDEDANGIHPKQHSILPILLFKEANATSTYYTKQSDGAIVFDFHKESFDVYNFSSETGGVSDNPMYPNLVSNIVNNTGSNWFSIDGMYRSQKLYYYVENGQLVIGWKKIDDLWYYFGVDEGMAQGITNIGGRFYYFSTEEEADDITKAGTMAVGFKKVNNHLYYFRKADNEISNGPLGTAVSNFATIDNELYYFRIDTDDISEGPKDSAVIGLANIGDETYYFRTYENEVSEGSEGSALKNGCVRIGKKGYCFDEDGHVSSITTYASVPTTDMCRNGEYTGSEQVLTYNALAGYTWSNNKGTNIGEYQVTASLKHGYMWDDETENPKTITCNIIKMQIIKPSVKYPTYNYVGRNITAELVNYNSNRMLLTGNLSGTNVGDYTITAALKNKSISEWSDGTDDNIVLNWSIVKTKLEKPYVYKFSGPYDGTAHTITAETIEGITLNYKTDDTDWSSVIPTRTDAGVTTVYVKALGNENYIDSDVATGTIEISKVQAAAPIVSNYGGRCDGYDHSITVEPVNDGTSGGSFQLCGNTEKKERR